MKRVLVFLLFGAVTAAVLVAADTPGVREQLRFGNEAAKRNLWNEARFRWQRALEIDPSNGAAHNNLGVALEREGKIEEALVQYRLAVKALPKDAYAQKNLSRCEELLQSARGSKKEKAK